MTERLVAPQYTQNTSRTLCRLWLWRSLGGSLSKLRIASQVERVAWQRTAHVCLPAARTTGSGAGSRKESTQRSLVAVLEGLASLEGDRQLVDDRVLETEQAATRERQEYRMYVSCTRSPTHQFKRCDQRVQRSAPHSHAQSDNELFSSLVADAQTKE
jgi:hypothetical protein